MNISEKIKMRREELGLTLQQVADKVGVNKTTVHYWEIGRTEKMKLDYILKLAKALRVEADSLVFDEDDLVEMKAEKLTDNELEQEILKLVQQMTFKEKIDLYNELSKEK